MTGTNHTLAGSIIAVLVPAPFVPLVALVSHFILDAIPHFGNNRHFPVYSHGDYSHSFKLLLLSDAILCFSALFFAWWLFPDKWLIITIGAFFAAGPDFLWILEPHTRNKFARAFYTFAKKIQWAEWSWGWVLEIVYAIIFTFILLYIA